jgi:translation initiation factor 1
MARRESDPGPDLDPLKGGLKHNPFAALGGRAPSKESSNSPPPSSKPPPQPTRERVTVRQERAGHGGKTVTVVEGPGLAGRDLTDLAREISRGLGVGARVEDGQVVVQGDQRERLAAWLESRGFGGVARGN